MIVEPMNVYMTSKAHPLELLATLWSIYTLTRAHTKPFYIKCHLSCVLYKNRNKKSIKFDYTDEWIIVYDGNKIESNLYIFQENEIQEYVDKGPGISGNPQRNFALTKITNPNALLYYLDGDNILHPNLHKLFSSY